MARLRDRLAHAWNVFTAAEETNKGFNWGYGASFGVRPDRVRFGNVNDKSIVTSVYTRIGIDVAAITIRHVKLDGNERYVETMKTGLNACLTLEANIDQIAQQFKQDIVMTLFDKGVVAVVPVDTDKDVGITEAFDIRSLRVGEILDWYPRHVKVNLYDERDGRRKEVVVEKSKTAIIENPLFAVMNEPNSTLQRLIRKLSILDSVDEASSSGKLDLIIQLPYVVKSEARKQQAENRAKEIEFQLKGSKYGIAYTDGTEKITQLNRPAENNLLGQIEFLTKMLYGQLGLTESVFNGTASEAEMLNYFNRTIEPILTAITQSMKRAFLTKTARTQGQSIEYFRDPFKLVPVSSIADIADKFARNEILTSNEIRGIIGFKPAADANADKLLNSNMPHPQVPTTPPDTL